MKRFMVSSGYGYNTRSPFIQIEHVDEQDKQEYMTQMLPAEARDLALNLLEAAEAAEQDAFLIEFSMEELGADMQSAAAVLHEFRAWRHKVRMEAAP